MTKMDTSSSLYCFVSGGRIHCVPVNSFNDFSNQIRESPLPPPPPNGTANPAILVLNAVGNGNSGTAVGPGIDIDSGANSTGANSTGPEDDNHLKIKNRNLLYALNNPSLSDIESDTSDFQEENQYLSGVINNYSTHALFLPDYLVDLSNNLNGDFSQTKALLKKVFSKQWVDDEKIEIERLTGGITNMLLKCSYGPKQELVLMRVYGPGTNLIIDRHREFILHLVLNSIDLAPSVHARFKNGLIYGFLHGRSLDPTELRNKNLYPLIAQQLGNWHSTIDTEEINNGVNQLRDFTRSHRRKLSSQIKVKDLTKDLTKEPSKEKKSKKRYISNIWELIEDWINIVPIVPELIQSFQENNKDVEVNESNIREVVLKEFKWLHKQLTCHSNSPFVSSHCDLLSGNIIIPNDELLRTEFKTLPSLDENPIKFIDYEYMLPAPRSFDIANHLAEWQGFDCDRDAIPEPCFENETIVNWVKAYLNDENAPEADIKSLIDEIHCYYGLPGFYWGIWAAIQSEISNIDFNYSQYSKLRLQEYWDWKSSFKLN